MQYRVSCNFLIVNVGNITILVDISWLCNIIDDYVTNGLPINYQYFVDICRDGIFRTSSFINSDDLYRRR